MKSILFTVCLAMLAISGSSQTVKITECVIEKGVLKNVEADYSQATGERTITIGGTVKKFYDVYPKNGPDYAETATWFINNEAVPFNGAKFVKYGLPRVLAPMEITKTGAYKGVGVYTESGMTEAELKTVEVIYIPVRSGCEFQPYQMEMPSCANVTLKADKKEFKTGDKVVFTATVTGALGKVSYEWYNSLGQVIGKTNGNKLTLSTANVRADVLAQVTVRVDGKRCHSSTQGLTVKVKK